MKTKTNRNKLQKSSGIFLPLGLVLTLLMVYFLLESKTAIAKNPDLITDIHSFDPDEFVQQKEIRIERKKAKQEVKVVDKKTANVRDVFTTTKEENAKETELPFEPEDAVIENINLNKDYAIIDEEPIKEDVPFLLIEDAPVFPGCEKKKTKQDKKDCFSSKLTKFISKEFNSDIADNLGLQSGVRKIYVQFIITKTGDIEIVDASAPHPRLEKEGRRIVNLLPKMIPGKQRNKPVNVTYMLPISFKIE